MYRTSNTVEETQAIIAEQYPWAVQAIKVTQNYIGEFEAVEGDYELDCKIGYGKTAEEAIEDLKERIDG